MTERTPKLLSLLMIAIAMSHPSVAQVDGFNKGRGNMDLIGSMSYEQSLGYFLADGTTSLSRYRASAALFAALGLTEDLDLQLSIPFIISNGGSGLQDGQLFLKWLPVKAALGNGKVTFGGAIGVSTPLTSYPTEGLGAIGQQATSITPMGVIQYTSGGGYFASLVAGHVATAAPTPDAVTGTFRFGHASAEHYWEGYAQMREAYGGKDYLGTGDLEPSTLTELGVSFLKAGGKYYRPIGNRFGYVGEVSYVVTGRNVDQAVMGAFSFIVHFRK